MKNENYAVTPRSIAPSSASNSAPTSLFQFQDNIIRTTVDFLGNPWFAAVDVCAALGIKNSRQAMTRLDDDEKGVISSDTNRGSRSVATVNESGLYELIFRSRKPEAKAFKRWVKQSVLPALRKDGMYVQGEENLFADCVTDGDYDKAIEVAQAHIAELFKAKALQKKAEHLEEKDARYTALRMMSRGRTRRRKGPK
jgi:prophage antirepressor-like protein